MQNELQRYGVPRFHYKYPCRHHDSSKQGRLGWFGESSRHGLSAKGVKTGYGVRSVSKTICLREAPAQFFDCLWKKNNGVFYRGTADGKGLGLGVMGEGTYLTWDEDMAYAFADYSSDISKGVPKVYAYKVPRDIKLLDYEGKTMAEIKKTLGVNPFVNVADPVFARILAYEVKKRGYDGVISDEKANGIVIFDSSKLKKVRR